MVLNVEENHAQKKFEEEREHYQRLTPDQLKRIELEKEVEQLKDELKTNRQTLSHLSDHLESTRKQIREIDKLIDEAKVNPNYSTGLFRSDVFHVMRR